MTPTPKGRVIKIVSTRVKKISAQKPVQATTHKKTRRETRTMKKQQRKIIREKKNCAVKLNNSKDNRSLKSKPNTTEGKKILKTSRLLRK
jgi:hypothetical protein